jgi:hypothetical protein
LPVAALLAASAALAPVATLAALPAIAGPALATPTDNRDAELLQLCDRAKELYTTIALMRAEMHRTAETDDDRYTMEFEDPRNAEIDPIDDECCDLVERITNLRAGQSEGASGQGQDCGTDT